MAAPPALPIELYQHICSLATAAPQAFGLSVKHIGQDDTLWWTEGRTLLDFKLALSTVSRQFREISLKYLFEVLIFVINKLHGRPSRVDSEVDVLPDPSFWDHARYLEIQRATNPRTRRQGVEEHRSFSQFAPRCRNTVAFKDETYASFPPLFFAPFSELCGHSLRRFEISSAEVPRNFPSLLTNFLPNLQYLRLSNVCPVWEESALTPSVITLPSLHTLCLENLVDLWKSAWDVPNL
jgi:hypothetical protein